MTTKGVKEMLILNRPSSRCVDWQKRPYDDQSTQRRHQIKLSSPHDTNSCESKDNPYEFPTILSDR